MQFADFSAASKDPEAELKRLIEQSYLTEAQANAVDLTRVEKFFTGPLGQRVLHADRVYKEQRFIASIPAGLTDKNTQRGRCRAADDPAGRSGLHV